jgi:hypothetical protein
MIHGSGYQDIPAVELMQTRDCEDVQEDQHSLQSSRRGIVSRPHHHKRRLNG